MRTGTGMPYYPVAEDYHTLFFQNDWVTIPVTSAIICTWIIFLKSRYLRYRYRK
jgi:hypothetical protein